MTRPLFSMLVSAKTAASSDDSNAANSSCHQRSCSSDDILYSVTEQFTFRAQLEEHMNTTIRFVALIVLGATLWALSAEQSRAADESAAECCKCRVQPARTWSDSRLPCDFDIPENWQAVVGDDGAAVSGAAGPRCDTVCPVSGGVAFSVANKPNANAGTTEEIWKQVMTVAGRAQCGGRTVTFFSLPGADPNGLIGGLRFHVGHGGGAYGANATFTCPGPGEWMTLQELFINTFKTNQSTTFGE